MISVDGIEIKADVEKFADDMRGIGISTITDIDRRIGIIRVSGRFLTDTPANIWDAFGAIEFVPDMIDRDFSVWEVLKFRGRSPRFDILTEGQRTPYYIVTITSDNEGNVALVDVSRE